MTHERNQPAFSLSAVASRLAGNGLEILGSFDLDEGERAFPERKEQPGSLAIVGNVGSAVWPYFEAERRERPTLSLDRWTEEVVGGIAEEAGLEAVYPFDGPPYHPFMRWAKRTGTLFSSPIGLTIHPTYGLWIAFRAALLIDNPLEDRQAPARRPCDDCEDRPCLTTCPVSAFTADGYDFEACLGHLATPGNACRSTGCLARLACPIGIAHRYRREHGAFHMEQLLKAHGRS